MLSLILIYDKDGAGILDGVRFRENRTLRIRRGVVACHGVGCRDGGVVASSKKGGSRNIWLGRSGIGRGRRGWGLGFVTCCIRGCVDDSTGLGKGGWKMVYGVGIGEMLGKG